MAKRKTKADCTDVIPNELQELSDAISKIPEQYRKEVVEKLRVSLFTAAITLNMVARSKN